MSFTKKVLGLFFVGMLLVVGVAKAQTAADLQAQIASLMAQIKALQAQLSTISSPSETWCHTFEKNLRIGDDNSEVAYLRMALLKAGFLENEASDVQVGNPNTENIFSESTSAAVTGFQQKYANEILTPVGLKYGTGFVGVGTRAKLNKLYGCGNSMPPIGCTMDAKQCPDGTYVSRTGPKCEFASCPIYKSLTVASPNGGETWVKGTTQTIKWQDISSVPTCPTGVGCPQLAPVSYDIALVKYQPCTGSTCSTQVSRIIAKGVYGRSYSWSVGARVPSEYSDEEVITPDGSYTIQVCRSGASICDSSDSYFKIVSSSAYKSITVISPNGGETLAKGTKQTISWKYNLAGLPYCETGADCLQLAPISYDIKLSAYATPCIGNICPMSLTRLPYIIAKNFSGNSYTWETGRVLDDSQYTADGAYLIQVCVAGSDVCDSSDSYFKITSTSNIGLPTISGVSGPTTLAVGQQGTWTVKASDPNNGNLYYSVVWGDESSATCALGGPCAAASTEYQQTATFTHTYNKAGYYSPRFAVKNANGSAETTLSVVVGSLASPCPLTATVAKTVLNSDGTWGFDITVSATNALTTDTWGTNFQGYYPTPTSYGETKHFGSFYQSSGPLQFTAKDQRTDNCSVTTTIYPPSTTTTTPATNL